MLSKIWKVTKIIAALIIGTVVGLTAFFFVGQILFPNFYKPYVVLSGSMEPLVPTGSVIFSKSSGNYQIGDVVTFDQGKGDIVTHRISKLENGQVFTKGDANKEEDAGTISSSQIIGKLAFTIPLLGYLIDFGKTPYGFILLVIIPATIIVYEELRSVKIELARLFKKKRMENNNQPNEPLSTPTAPSTSSLAVTTKRGIPKVFALVPILGSLFLIVAATGAYFSDQEKSTQNKMGAASNFESQSSVLALTTEPTPASFGELKVSEVYLGDSSPSQWLEIYNPGPSDIDISNWSIHEGVNCDGIMGGTIIPTNGYAIVSPYTQTEFFTYWPDTPPATAFIHLDTAIGNGLAPDSNIILSSSQCESSPVVVDQVVASDKVSAIPSPGL